MEEVAVSGVLTEK